LKVLATCKGPLPPDGHNVFDACKLPVTSLFLPADAILRGWREWRGMRELLRGARLLRKRLSIAVHTGPMNYKKNAQKTLMMVYCLPMQYMNILLGGTLASATPGDCCMHTTYGVW
jgi:hypothetical protein